MRRLLVPLLVIGAALLAAPTAQATHGPTAEIVDSTRPGGRTVALTFDDGPDPQNTPKLLAVLRRHHVRAVFCLWGEHVRQHPALVRRIVAEGHLLCNHSMNHDDLSTWSADAIRADLLATNAAIRDAVPWAHIPYFRAPYGAWGQSPTVAAGLGMQPLGWRLAIGDWEPPARTCWSNACSPASPPALSCCCTTAAATEARPWPPSPRSSRRSARDGWHLTRPARRG